MIFLHFDRKSESSWFGSLPNQNTQKKKLHFLSLGFNEMDYFSSNAYFGLKEATYSNKDKVTITNKYPEVLLLYYQACTIS